MKKSLWIAFNLKVLLIGRILFHSLDYAFDYALYPFVIWKLGLPNGFFVMAGLAAAVNLLTVKFYDWLKKDWLGIEGIKELIDEFFKELEEEAAMSLRRAMKKFLQIIFHRNLFGQFLFLSLKFDPLITTLYMRKGHARYNGFSKRDWKIFWGSVAVSNLWWSSLSATAVTIVKNFLTSLVS